LTGDEKKEPKTGLRSYEELKNKGAGSESVMIGKRERQKEKKVARKTT